MTGFCTSQPFGFTDLSTDITMFDQDVSKSLVVVKDFRVSEMAMEENSPSSIESNTQADGADITSVVRWNYALDIMSPEDISRVVTKIPSRHRLVEVRTADSVPKFRFAKLKNQWLNPFAASQNRPAQL